MWGFSIDESTLASKLHRANSTETFKRDFSKMIRQLVVVFVVVLYVSFCAAQVNFSPNWGKRALNNPSDDNENGCKESVDTLILIYKIIQSEAQKLLECEKMSN